MKYIAHIGITVYIAAIAGLAQGQEPHRGGCRDHRNDCLVSIVAAKDDGGYVPPNHGGPDTTNGSGTRYK
ncbi:MAG: hypothetical protein V7L31_20880 [Nostoc sp.]|uniref:hypothetical protein n=1 Tax=Nostoc sp. TaxID=1180 RepID=UPI002FEE7E98